MDTTFPHRPEPCHAPSITLSEGSNEDTGNWILSAASTHSRQEGDRSEHRQECSPHEDSGTQFTTYPPPRASAGNAYLASGLDVDEEAGVLTIRTATIDTAVAKMRELPWTKVLGVVAALITILAGFVTLMVNLKRH